MKIRLSRRCMINPASFPKIPVYQKSCEPSVPDQIGGLRHSGILKFFLIAYAISWTGWLVIFARHFSFLAGSGFWFYLLAVLAPHISAVLCMALERGADGLRTFYRLVFRRVRWLWGLAALAVPPLLNLAQDGLVLGLHLPHGPFFKHPPRTVTILVLGQLAVILGEEPGWRGFALPRLIKNPGPKLGTLVLGVLWAFWHLPLFLIPGTAQYGTPFWPFVITLIAWSMVITLLVLQSRASVIPAMLFHLSANLCDFTMWEPAEYWLALGPWVIVAAIAAWRMETREPPFSAIPA
jgi:CAAX protease family protein